MKKRLAWNFEINIGAPFALPVIIEPPQMDLHWEFRFFWPEQDMIILHGLDERFLELSRYNIKHRSDTYVLLPNVDYNIKQRRDKWIYKPLREKTIRANAYGKKITIEELTAAEPNLQHAINEGQPVLVNKEAMIYKFESHLATKLELARLTIHHQIYFSIGIESQTRALVEALTQRIIGDQETSDYVYFLKQLRKG